MKALPLKWCVRPCVASLAEAVSQPEPIGNLRGGSAVIFRTMPSIARILLTSAILLGIISLIEWGAWRNVNRMCRKRSVGADSVGLEVVTLVQYIWTIVYFIRWPYWREFSIGWLLLTHAVLISLVVPKLFLCGWKCWRASGGKPNGR